MAMEGTEGDFNSNIQLNGDDSTVMDVYKLLQCAGSQNPEVLKPAETVLKQLETQSGFYTKLQCIFSDYTIDTNIRWLAVVYFKNGVDKYWRKMAPNAISEEEKTHLRQMLLQSFREPVTQIATQLSVLIGKIARQDCPANWPDLVPILLEGVRTDDLILQNRTLLALHQVTKTLASKRLAADRKVFEQMTSQTFEFLLDLWIKQCDLCFSSMQPAVGDLQQTALSMDHGILTLKVLRKLAVFGIKDVASSQPAINFITQCYGRIDEFLKLGSVLPQVSAELLPKREKLLNLLTKVLLDMQQYHPEAFVPFITPSFEMSVKYNFTDEGNGLLFERFSVNTLNLVRSILRCDVYKLAKDSGKPNKPATLAAHQAKSEFFTPACLGEVLRRLVSHYFLLTEEDLCIWDSDPEQFVCDEGGDAWMFTLRPCTEHLFLTLMKEYREILSQVVIELIKQVQEIPVNTEDLGTILSKDAVYNAAGLAAFDLFDDLNFNQWFTGSLLMELKVVHTNYRVLRRRVIWLIGCWVGIQMSTDLRTVLYEALTPLLLPAEDLVVRLEAAATLKVAIDDFEFDVEMFLPYLQSLFGLLFELLKEVQECETKMQVLHVMSFMIERVGRRVRPYAHILCQYLPLLWQESADHNMLRCAILTTLVSLTQGMGVECVNMYDFVIPVIHMSTDVSQDQHVYLLEDALELWHATLQCAPAMTPELLHLYTNMQPLLEIGTETLRTCLMIIETYVILCPKEFLQEYSRNLLGSLSSMINEVRTEGTIMILKLIELIFKIFPEEGPIHFTPFVLQAFTALATDEQYPMIATLYTSLIARVVLENQQFFNQVLQELASQKQVKDTDVLGELLDIWIDKFDNMTQTEHRKLTALALVSLIASNTKEVLERLGPIFSICVETLNDIWSGEEGCQVDSLVICQQTLSDDELDTEHDVRKRKMNRRDPVHRLCLRENINIELEKCRQQYTPEMWNSLMATVEGHIVEQLKEYLA